jgi:hypothetical protein
MPKAEAFAVKGDRFLAVGSNDDILHLASANTVRIDAEGMTIVPGLSMPIHIRPEVEFLNLFQSIVIYVL